MACSKSEQPKSVTLATLGYEGLAVDRYLETVLAAGVQLVVDVRRIPMSRRPGYSKKRFAESCGAVGLGYIHMVDLGTPRDVLYAYRETHDRAEFSAAMNAYLDTQESAIRALADLAASQTACLLCYEADPAACHRRAVSERVQTLVGPDRCEVLDLQG